jgi:hypothetical protein
VGAISWRRNLKREAIMNTNVAIAAVLSAGVMMWSYLTDFYPVYTVVGCIGVMIFLAFKGPSTSVRKPDAKLCLPSEEPPYVE